MALVASRQLVEIVGFIVTALVAFMTLMGVIYQARKTRAELTPGNGHTIGRAVARIEEMLWRHEHRLDSLDIEMREMKEVMVNTKQEDKQQEVLLITEWVKRQMEDEENT